MAARKTGRWRDGMSLWVVLAGVLPLFAAPGESFSSFTGTAAWCWYQDPRAIYYKGTKEKTYAGFIDNAGTIKVWSYDHQTGQTAQSVLHTALQIDDHDAPSLFLRTDRRITAYYSRHGTDRFIFYRTTVNPEDIATWQAEDTIITPQSSMGTCYTHEFQLSGENNRIYLFTRNLNWHPSMLHSDDNGATWSSAREMVQSSDRPYIKFVSDGATKIHCAFTDGHPRVQPANSIYYAYYEKGKFYKASGAVIEDTSALPMDPKTQADIVYNGSTSGKAWIWDIALDALKRPVMVFAVFPNDQNHHYYYARWTGTAWFKKDLVNSGKWFPQTPAGTTEREPNYSGGISLDHGDPSIVYLSRFVNNQCEVEKWVTTDGGTTWSSKAVTSGSAKRNVRPIAAWPQPYGAASPAKKLLFWMNGDYIHYENYTTAIRWSIDSSAQTFVALPAKAGRSGACRVSATRNGFAVSIPVAGEIVRCHVSIVNLSGKVIADKWISGSHASWDRVSPAIPRGLYFLCVRATTSDGRLFEAAPTGVFYLGKGPVAP